MKLELFTFIDDTLSYYEQKMPAFEYAKNQVTSLFRSIFQENTDSLVSYRTRIKTADSLKEKLIRNEFYLNYSTPEEAIDNLSDLIGITMQCRFIRNEAEIYKELFRYFEDIDTESFSRCRLDNNVFLNLHMPQPQLQRNGFTIYRLDGFYMFHDSKINFELQIKSLVHTFWSEIEHEVVYKNPDFIMFDQFNRNMLGAIRDNLDVVDRQLEIMYDEISSENKNVQIGMDEQSFKVFFSRSINELVNRNMKESVGFTTDFKKCSAMIAQYVYLHDFVNGEHNREMMIEYLERLSLINEEKVDFSQKIKVEGRYRSDDPFCDVLGKYMEEQMNHDFQWHVFFTMLFIIQQGHNLTTLNDFCEIIEKLLIQPGWYKTTFSGFTHEDRISLQNHLKKEFAKTLKSIGSIRIIQEDMLYRCMNIFHTFIENTEMRYSSAAELKKDLPRVTSELNHMITKLFR